MKNKLMLSLLALILTTMTLTVEAKVPSQIIYRYDNNRYLELKGFNSDGALWYHDTTVNIHKE